MNVILTGYRCSGKSTVSDRLADALGWKAVHVDREIASRAGQRIVDLVKDQGWQRFRDLEVEVLAAATSMDKVIIDAGGSVVLNEGHLKMLRIGGRVIWLRTSASEVRARMRCLDVELVPLTEDSTAIEEVDRMMERFNPLYKAAADQIIDTDGRSAEEIVAEILSFVETC
jgi:shikimate kinase